LAACLWMASLPTLAETPVLEEIIVTATRSEKSIQFSPYSVGLVTGEQIRQSTQDQLADLVASLPGVFVSDAGQAGQKRIRLRGEEARRMALLVDGQEFMDHREVGVPLLVDPSRIQRIELVRGPASVLYGPKAMGGVINVITDRTITDNFSADLSLALNGSTEGYLAALQLRGLINDNLQWHLGGFQNDQDLRETPEGEVENTAYQSDGINLSLSQSGTQHSWRIGFEDFNADSDVYVEPEVRFSPPFRDFIIDIPRRDRQKIRADYRYSPEGNYLQSMIVDGYRQISDRQFNTFPLMTLAPGLDLDTSILTTSDLTTNGLNVQSDWQTGNSVSVIAGLQWLDDEINQLRDREVKTNGITTSKEIQTDAATLRNTAVYLQGDIDINEDLALLLGARHYRVSSEHQASNHNATLRDNDDSHTIGSAAVIYSLSDNSVIRATWSEGYIYPSLLNLVVGAFAGSSFINPVATLAPETSDTFEIGYRTGTDSYSVDAALFLTQAENYIDHVPCAAIDNCPGARDQIYKNIGEANSHGVEISSSYRTGQISLDGNITWMQRKKDYDGVDSWDSGIPRITGQISATYALAAWQRPLDIKLAVRFESDTDELVATRRGFRTDSNPGYGVVDLAVRYITSSDTLLSLTVANMGDKKYHSATENLYAAGRHARLKIAHSF
jgi:hemoglobin/transferrin/lactoferrin receptor protein